MEATRKLFYEDVTRCSFCATVLACEPHNSVFRVALDATAFYPEGGGQPADQGALGGACVCGVQEKDGVIWHTVTTPLRVGETVQGDVDAAHRLEMMQQHTGEHIVSGIVHAQYGYDNVGFHIGEETLTVDFSGPLTAPELDEIEQAANWVVWQNKPVEISFPTAAELAVLSYRSKKELTGSVRIVTIPAADVCACCGTHVRTTSEVGLIKLLSGQSYKGGTRVAMVCGMRALRDYRDKERSVSAISVRLSAKPAQIASAVERLEEENAALRGKLADTENTMFRLLSEQHAGQRNTVCFLENLSPDSLRRCSLALSERCDGVCAAFSAIPDGFSYAVSSKGQDVRALGKAMNAALCGRGGGKAELIQGSVQAERAAVEAFFASL